MSGKPTRGEEQKAKSKGDRLIVGDKVYIADEDGDVEILRSSRSYEKIFEQNHHGSKNLNELRFNKKSGYRANEPE